MIMSLTSTSTESIRTLLNKANTRFNTLFPGESTQRQPVHTVYGGAHLFKADTVKKLGSVAQATFYQYVPSANHLSESMGVEGTQEFIEKVYSRIQAKLQSEAVEDFRIDFEDGYGNRSDSEEDAHATSVAAEVAQGKKGGTLPPFIGIRIKPFSEEQFTRSMRTLDIFVSTLVTLLKGKLPEGFRVTLPKVTSPDQVTALVRLLELLETRLGLSLGQLKLELMIETPQAIFNSHGEIALPHLISAAEGRCLGAHFGTYDYTASCHITAAHQQMLHPACDFARHVMQVSLAGTGVQISDGATQILPVGPYRAVRNQSLTEKQNLENQRVVFRAWKINYHHIQHSLTHAFYQGWDLHPAQLPVRYAAIYSFFLQALEPTTRRLKAFIEKAAQATLSGDVFDDAATGQGLLNFFLRGLNCGAITEDEMLNTGLSLQEMKSRSFQKILQNRR